MKSVIGALRVTLGLDSAEFQKGARRATDTLGDLRGRFMAISTGVAAAGAALGSITRVVAQSANEIDALSRIADTSPETFQRMAAAARTVGIEQDKLADILKDVKDRVGDFLATGGGEMADFFENIAPRVGVTAEQFRDLSGPDALGLYVSSLEKAGVSQAEMTFYLEAVADDLTRLQPLLANGGAEMERLGERAARFGAVLDADTIAAMRRTELAFQDVGLVFRGMRYEIARELAPSVERMATAFTALAAEGAPLRVAFSAVAGNLDRLATYAATAVAVVGGRYVAALAAARVATLGLSGALGTLRGALIRTGFGVLVVGAGEAVFQFGRLVSATGGLADAFSALKGIGDEVFQRLQDRAQATAASFRATFYEIAATITQRLAESLTDAGIWADKLIGFGVGAANAYVAAWANVGKGIAKLLQGAANVIGSATAGILNNVRGQINTFVGGLNRVFAALPLSFIGGQRFEAKELPEINYAPLKIQALEEGQSVGEAFREGLSGSYTGPLGSELDGIADSLRSAAASSRETADSLTASAQRPLASFEKLRSTIRAAAGEIEASGGSADDLLAALDEIAGAEGAAAGGGGGGGGAAGAASAIDDVVDAADRLKDSLGGPLAQSVGVATDAFGGFVSRGLRDFEGFASDIKSGFQRLIAEMVATAAKNRILIGLGIAAPTQAMAGAGGLGGLGGLFAGGAGGLFSALGSGGLGGAASYLGGALSTATTSMAGFANALGAVAPVVGVAGLAFAAFRKRTEELDRGLRVTANGMDVLVETFRKTQSSRLFGLIKSRDTDTDAASAEVAAPLQAAVRGIQRGVTDAASALGVGSRAFQGFAYELSISTKGMSQDEALREVQARLGELGDAFAGMVPGLTRLQAEGEALTETLSRMVGNLQGVNTTLRGLGFDALDRSLSNASRASWLAGLAGGVDQFAQAGQFFFDNFLSLNQRTELLSKRFRQSVREITDRAIPETEGAFRRLVKSLESNGQLGDATKLLGLGPLFVELRRLQAEMARTGEAAKGAGAGFAEAARDLAAVARERQGLLQELWRLQGRTGALREAERAALDPANRALFDRVEALKRAQAAEERAARVADEREGLERRYLEALGDEAELRRRALAELHPTNRAFAQMVEGLEAAKRAMQALDPQDYESRVDFERARGLAANGVPVARTATGVPLSVVDGAAPSVEATAFADMLAMARQHRDLLLRIEENTHRGSQTLRRWDRDGQPAERA